MSKSLLVILWSVEQKEEGELKWLLYGKSEADCEGGRDQNRKEENMIENYKMGEKTEWRIYYVQP